MAVVISQSMQSVDKSLLESWLNVQDDRFVTEVCGWTIEDGTVTIPLNKENEARGTVVRENVKFDRKFTTTVCVFSILGIAKSYIQNSQG